MPRQLYCKHNSIAGDQFLPAPGHKAHMSPNPTAHGGDIEWLSSNAYALPTI